MATIFQQKPYVTWSNENQKPVYDYSPLRQVSGYAMGAAGLAGAFALSQQTFAAFGGEKLATQLYRGLEVGERFLLPAGLMATLRLPFLVSPFIDHGRIREPTGDFFQPQWSKEHLTTGTNSGKILESLLDTDYASLRRAHTEGFRFEYNKPGGVIGSVFIGQDVTPIKRNAMLFQRGRTRHLSRGAYAALAMRNPDLAEQFFNDSVLNNKTGTKSIADAVTDIQSDKIKPDFFWHVGAEISKENGVTNLGRTSEMVPIAFPEWGARARQAGKTGLANTLDALSAGVGYARIYSAMTTQRLNFLLRTVTEQVPILSDIAKVFPASIAVKDSAALPMLFRYAGKAGILAGTFVAAQELSEDRTPIKQQLLYGFMGATLGGWLKHRGEPDRKFFSEIFSKPMRKWWVGGAVLSVMPGFRHGLLQGLGFGLTRLSMAHSIFSHALSPLPIIGAGYRDLIDRWMPGASEGGTATGIGVLGVAGYALKEHFKGIKFGNITYKPQRTLSIAGLFKRGRNDLVDNVLREEQRLSPSNAHLWRGGRLADVRIAAIDSARKHALTYQASHLQYQINHDADWAEKIMKAKGFWNKAKIQVKAAFAGAEPGHILNTHLGDGWWTKPSTRALPGFGKHSLRFMGIAIAWHALMGGFAAKESPKELSDLYEGRELVPVRRGRFWEGGGTPYEGADIMYYRPHWYRSLMTKAKEIGQWGEELGKTGPLTRWFKKNLTYEQEAITYDDRPYPITRQALDETPFLSFLMNPIGKLIKPGKIMHADEWMRVNAEGEIEYKQVSKPLDIPTAYWLGGIKPNSPISPYAGSALFGQQVYQYNELRGFAGWAESLIHQGLSGTSSPFAQDTWLASSKNIDSDVKNFWDLELGGMFFLSEGIRRFVPKHRSEIGLYNPIPNNLPSWMPNDLKTGDPYSAVKEGEYRLPGPGYEALYPELRGVDRENYPLIHKYNILSQSAPYSDEFRSVEQQVKYYYQRDLLSEADSEFAERIAARATNKRYKRESDNYIYQMNEDTKSMGIIGKAVRGLWKGFNRLVHNIFAGPEKLFGLGFRPSQKLFPYLDPIEEYEDSVIYGSRMAFWDKPWGDWFRPAFYQTLHDWSNLLTLGHGWDGIPAHIKKERELNDYFDKLEFYKWKNLQGEAEQRGDERSARLFKKLARRTVYGVNPYERDSVVKASMPDIERSFFDAFASEWDDQRRQRILELVPESIGRILEGQWTKRDLEYTQKDEEKLNEELSYYEGHSGLPSSAKLEAMYNQQAPDWQTYGDWYRMQELDAYFGSKPLPRPDWVGWNPAVDLEDVKMKVIMNNDEDIHDYSMWESQQRLLKYKPYINNTMAEQVDLYGDSMAFESEVDSFEDASQASYTNTTTMAYPSMYEQHSVEVYYSDSRQRERNAYKNRLGL